MVGITRLLVAVTTLTLGCGDNIKLSSDAGSDAAIDAAVDAGQLDFPDDPNDYEVGIVSYVSELTLPAVNEGTPICCHDFGAISEDDGIDNSFVKFIDILEDLGTIDMQTVYDDVLENELLVWLFDHRGLNVERTDQFTLAMLYGKFDGPTTIVEARAGEGIYKIRSRSFETGTGTPRSYFTGATYNKPIPSILAGPREIFVPFPISGGYVDVPLKRARVSGMATVEVDGVTYVEGELSGYILEDDFYEAFNDTLAERCSCISAELPIFSKNGSDWEADCPDGATVEANCAADDEEICVTIAAGPAEDGLCQFWTSFSGVQLDIDSDGDEEFDAVSFGLLFSTVDATVVDGIE